MHFIKEKQTAFLIIISVASRITRNAFGGQPLFGTYIQGAPPPPKKRERHTSNKICGCNNWYQGMMGYLEKNDTKNGNFVSVVCFHWETMSRPAIVPFQLKLGLNECRFGLP